MNAEQIYNYLDEQAPFSAQATWDNSGFQIGERTRAVQKVLFALDATADLVREAAALQCDLIVTHHPFIFSPIKALLEENPAYLAAKYGIAVICAHTSYDFALGGVSDVLAQVVGLQNIQPSVCGEFRLGDVKPQSAVDFALLVQTTLQTKAMVSLPSKMISRVALCGGAGADFIGEAKRQGADLFLTGEAKHHEILDACALDMAVVCAGHFETEQPAVRALCERVQTQFPEITCILSKQTSPILRSF